jgi:hypothetical protein
MTSVKYAFGQSWETGVDKRIFMSFQNSEMLPYPTVNIPQYGHPLIIYTADKQIHMFILLNQIL